MKFGFCWIDERTKNIVEETQVHENKLKELNKFNEQKCKTNQVGAVQSQIFRTTFLTEQHPHKNVAVNKICKAVKHF